VKGSDLESGAVQQLLACLQDVPFVKSISVGADPCPVASSVRPDALLRLQLSTGEQILLVEVKASGQPRYARAAVNQLLRFRQSYPDAYGVFAAADVSPQAAAICRQEGVGYVDLAGNCFLSFGQVHIHRERRPDAIAQKRYLRSLYSPKAERVLRTMLSNPGHQWTVQSLAQEAQVSLGHAHNVKQKLVDREWLQVGSQGFALAQPLEVLLEWSQNYTWQRNQAHHYYSMASVADIETALGQVCHQYGIRYALAGFSAAARLASFVRYQRAMAYVADDRNRIVRSLRLKEVTTGANVTLLAPYDEGVLYGLRDMGDAAVAAPVQVYLDLCSMHGRAEEAAQFLLEQVIEPEWQLPAVTTQPMP
jgi:hypothetical protein